jgi:hypothetical protein
MRTKEYIKQLKQIINADGHCRYVDFDCDGCFLRKQIKIEGFYCSLFSPIMLLEYSEDELKKAETKLLLNIL